MTRKKNVEKEAGEDQEKINVGGAIMKVTRGKLYKNGKTGAEIIAENSDPKVEKTKKEKKTKEH